MENKNTFIAIALMLLVWVGFTIMFPTPQAPVPQTVAVVAPVAQPESALQPIAASVISVPNTDLPVTTQVAVLRDVTIETELYRAVFTTVGGQLKSFQLKHYKATTAPDSLPVELVTAGDGGTVRVSGESDLSVSKDARFFCKEERSSIQLKGNEQFTLSFQLPLPTGLVLIKEYTFTGNNYSVDLAVAAQNGTSVAKQGKLTLGLVEATDRVKDGSESDFAGSVTFDGKKLRSDTLDALIKGDKEYGAFEWSAYKSKYFLRAVAPLDNAVEKVVIHKSGATVEHRFQSPTLSIDPGKTASHRYLLYFGPMEMNSLKLSGHNLEQSIDLGWFALLARPFFGVMTFFYSYVGNYGWSIIFLTVIIKLLFWPLTNKSYASMKAMQKLQPQMQKLREKHKNDRDKMNIEIMGLYKEHRVNPLGGCLPMLVQIPVFFALYQVLMNMIELRHAPFMLWITDLSAKDPYYVTPLIMGATMFIQQKLTPSQLDPIQQKIFLVMPVVFTFLFLTFPSGLVIYWMVSNLLTILQQILINRRPD